MRRWLTILLALVLWWTAVAAVYAEMLSPLARIARPDLRPEAAILISWLSWLLWVPLSLLFIAAVERFPATAGRLRAAGAAAVVCIAVALTARAAFIAAANDIVPLWYVTTPPFAEIFRDSARLNFILAGLVMGASHAVHFARANADSRARIAALEGEMAQARLDALAAQLNPHFLFNALNTIAETVHVDPRAADGMIVSLSALLRESLDRSGQHLIPLSEELAILEHYLSLQRLRFGDRLVSDIRVARGCENALVPRLVLQPLVENAIVHGMRGAVAAARIGLDIGVSGERLVLTLTNDGAPKASRAGGRGIGLANVRQRLETLFPGRAQLTISAVAGPRTEVVVSQPFMLPATT